MTLRKLYRVICQYKSPRNGQLEEFVFDTVLSRHDLPEDVAMETAVKLAKHLMAGTATLNLTEPVYSYMGEDNDARQKSITGAYIKTDTWLADK